jgi:outer membrane protein
MWFKTRIPALALVLALPLALPFVSAAQSLKVGYTDAQLIVAQMDDYRSIMTQLQQLAEGSQGEFEELQIGYQEQLADYQQKQALLSDQARQNREKELVAKQAEIQQFLQNKEQELAEEEANLMNPLLEKVQTAINDVAAEKGLNVVLNAQAGGSPVLLYADEEMDITEAVMSKLGIEIPAAQESGQ